MTNLFKKKFIRVPNMAFGNVFKEIGRNAFVDWAVILIIISIITVSLITVSIYLYIQITNGTYKGTKKIQPLSQKIFDKGQLTSIINLYQSKQDNSIQIMKGYRGTLDPSQ